MNAKPVVVEGIVKRDGTLEIEGKIPMPAGKVRITLEELPWTFEDHPFWKMLQEIWAACEKAGLKLGHGLCCTTLDRGTQPQHEPTTATNRQPSVRTNTATTTPGWTTFWFLLPWPVIAAKVAHPKIRDGQVVWPSIDDMRIDEILVFRDRYPLLPVGQLDHLSFGFRRGGPGYEPRRNPQRSTTRPPAVVIGRPQETSWACRLQSPSPGRSSGEREGR